MYNLQTSNVALGLVGKYTMDDGALLKVNGGILGERERERECVCVCDREGGSRGEGKLLRIHGQCYQIAT